MERTCTSCEKTLAVGYFSSFWKWCEAKSEMIEFHRGECRPCYAERSYKKHSKAFGAKLSEQEEKDLRELWPSHKTESLASIHRDAKIKMTYLTFLKYCRDGRVEKWYQNEE